MTDPISSKDSSGMSGGQPNPADERGLVHLDQGHHVGDGGTPALPAHFENPGLPPHLHRMADHDEKAAKRAEKQVAAWFTLSIVAAILFVVAYFAIPQETTIFLPGIGKGSALNIALGVTIALALLGIGIGAVHWAKTIMPDTEVVEERHDLASSPETRTEAVDLILGGGEAAQLARRPLIKATLGGALGLFALPFVVQLAGSLGPGDKAHKELATTLWDAAKAKPLRLVRDPELTPVKAADVTIGSVFHILPENIKDSTAVLEDKGKAGVLLMRLEPGQFDPGAKGQKALSWGYNGIVAYSVVCTHVGCPVGLYEQQTHHLLCPCHQSTFDVTNDCEVIFGPAGHPLPQLKISVDDSGYLVATQGFTEPVGPSYWERTS